jgi:hypothetical protein
MKNIHIIQTDKPNVLIKDFNNKLLLTNVDIQHLRDGYQFQYIYITSDEEIKEGDYYIDFTSDGLKIEHFKTKDDWVLVGICDSKKIILTTDQDLIKDGVQAIDDTFLEWFVKNASCESVEVKNYKSSEYPLNYKIIIPQEEHKQETLEEYAERLAKAEDLDNYKSLKELLIHIAEWQSKRMYSEEEVEQIFNIGQMIKNFLDYKPYTFKEALEQFKKTN